jgi:hypothetical protein
MENKKNILPIIAVFIFTAALASIIIWFVLNRNKTETPTTDQTQIEESAAITEAIPTEMPTPTPTPMIVEVNKALKLQVLNATEINGQAATVKAELAALGFTSIAVGNSKEIATSNQVKLKASLSTASAYFQGKLDTTFPATYTTDLPASSQYDAVFIIGTDLSTGASAVSTTTTTTTVTPTKAKTTVTPTPSKKVTPTVTPAE